MTVRLGAVRDRCRHHQSPDLSGVVVRVLLVLGQRHLHGTSWGVGSMSTAPARRHTAASTSEATSPTARSGVSVMRSAWLAPLCSTTTSWARRSSTATSDPEPSGAGSGAVSHRRAVSRSAAFCGFAVPAAPAWRRVCPEPGHVRAACRMSRPTAGRNTPAIPKTPGQRTGRSRGRDSDNGLPCWSSACGPRSSRTVQAAR